MRNVPPIARPTNMTAVLAAVNERMRSRVTGNIGEDVRVSHHMNSGKLTTAATNSAMMVAEVQPHVSPWTSASVRQKRPAPEMTMPGMSMPPSAFSLRSPRGMIARAGDDGDDADRDVDEEDPRPVAVGHEHAAEHGTDGGGGRPQRAPDADGRALLPLGEGAEHDRQRDGEQRRAAEALAGAEGDQPLDVGREAAEQREERERHEPEDEDALLPVAVGDPAHGEEEDGEHEVVGVEHPRGLAQRGVQVGDDRRHRDVDDGDVEQRHEHAEADDDEDPPLARVTLVDGRVGRRVRRGAGSVTGRSFRDRCGVASCRASARRTKVSSKVAGTTVERGRDAGGVEGRADGGEVAAGHAQVAADEGGREAGRAERGEGLRPSGRPGRRRRCRRRRCRRACPPRRRGRRP